MDRVWGLRKEGGWVVGFDSVGEAVFVGMDGGRRGMGGAVWCFRNVIRGKGLLCVLACLLVWRLSLSGRL